MQGLLWPLKPREVAERIGLDWWAALKLYDDGWLSFNPAKDEITDAETEAEFVFLGSLVAAGCDPPMLKRLLDGLEKPYRYDIGRMYYDWRQRQWQDMPEPAVEPEVPSPEESFESWLDELVEDRDVATLSGIVDAVGAALDRAEEAIGKGQEAQE